MKKYTLGKYDLQLGRALRPWSYFKVHKTDTTWHLVWGSISLFIEDWTAKVYTCCKVCQSPDIGEKSLGDESWTICESCGSIEQGYRYLNKREWEKL